MKAALFYGGADIRLADLPVPAPGPGEVLVRVGAAGICGSDLHGYRGAWPRPGAATASPESLQDGHELAGLVEALGAGVQGLRPGQRVGIEPEHLVGCGACSACRRGDAHLCPSRGRPHGERQKSHGFSEYDVCVAPNVHPLPDNVELDEAAILDCYGCAVHAMRRAPVGPRTTVAVLGTGAIGITVGQVARACGARRVVIVGTRRQPLDVAIAAGAADGTALLADGPDALREALGGGADIVFETVGGTADTLGRAVDAAERGGTVCILGIFTGVEPFDPRPAYGKELNVVWSNSYSYWGGVSEYEIALDMLASGRVAARPLITHHYPLSDIGAAFAAAADKRASSAIKVIVNP